MSVSVLGLASLEGRRNVRTVAFGGTWSALLLCMLAATVSGLVLYNGVALAAPIGEVEPNDSIAQAQDIDGSFSLDYDPDIGDVLTNTSTTIPHATVIGTGDDTVEVYSFTVSRAGERGIFDVDYAWDWEEGGFDSWLTLYDGNGNPLDASDDADPDWGAGGSTGSYLDSYLEFYFDQPGTYYIEVSDFPGGWPIPSWGGNYELQVSLRNHPVGSDEPKSKGECKKGGWRNFQNPDERPMFKNQGDCVSFVASEGKKRPGA